MRTTNWPPGYVSVRGSCGSMEAWLLIRSLDPALYEQQADLRVANRFRRSVLVGSGDEEGIALFDERLERLVDCIRCRVRGPAASTLVWPESPATKTRVGKGI